jgi:hypothetical protein
VTSLNILPFPGYNSKVIHLSLSPCFRGRFGCLTGASTVFWDLGFTWVLGVVGAFLSGGFDGSFYCFWVLSL